ncbi:uncharacterized protein LOC103513601 isoform X2 [Diaphorina citri]|uniref:Uncharacterized protein LOC103513601 isoform X2 n=1 Tax=Diaphorina citri TaxID=121845 RepID=A0A3Q0J2A4_DIACI|nr:uncharacterized protein LOC103513601 isoform X2 [Diaphorina citri]
MVWVTLHLLVDAEEVVLQVKVDRTAQHYEDENARNELISSVIMNYRSMNCDYTSVINFKSMSFVESEEAAQEQTIMESSPSASTSGEQSEGFIETPNVADDSLMDDFEVGKRKLELADYTSDVNSDGEQMLKNTRKFRKRKHSSSTNSESDFEESEQHYPPVPNFDAMSQPTNEEDTQYETLFFANKLENVQDGNQTNTMSNEPTN